MSRRRWMVVGALVGGLAILRVEVFDLVLVRTQSMVPGVLPGDLLLVLRGGRARTGDVVVAELPGQDGLLHVKRVVAEGGQVVELAGGKLYVDGKLLDGPADTEIRWVSPDCTSRTAAAAPEGAGLVIPGGRHRRVELPQDTVWLLGDNRAESSDSRHWGPVPLSSLGGRVLAVIFSLTPCGAPRPNRIGRRPSWR